jgi:hypothetical protein
LEYTTIEAREKEDDTDKIVFKLDPQKLDDPKYLIEIEKVK